MASTPAAAEAGGPITLTRFTMTFVDKAIEAEFRRHIFKDGSGTSGLNKLLNSATAFFVAYLFATFSFNRSPTDLQIALAAAEIVPFLALAVFALAAPRRWCDQLLHAPERVRVALMGAILLSSTLHSLIIMDEFRINARDFGDDERYEICRNFYNLVLVMAVLFGLFLLAAMMDILTPVDKALVAVGNVVLLQVAAVTAYGVVVELFIFVGMVAVMYALICRQLRTLEHRRRYMFLLVRRLQRENISVQLMVAGPLARVQDGGARPTAPSWLIDPAELELGEPLGTGGYGSVVRGTWRGTAVAVKQLHDTGNDRREELLHEASILLQLRHSNIVLFLAMALSDSASLLVLELCHLGSLADVMERAESEPGLCPWPRRVSLLAQAANGMSFLHKSGVLHRDLKPANILIDQRWTAKVSDFGLSQASASSEGDRGDDVLQGTLLYCAPEVLRGGAFSSAADVYSFGITMWEAATGRPPFVGEELPGASLVRIAREILDGKRPLLSMLPSEVDAGLSKLAERCWDADPDLRPDFLHIFEELASRENRLLPDLASMTDSSSFATMAATSVVILSCPRVHAMMEGVVAGNLRAIAAFSETASRLVQENAHQLLSSSVSRYEIRVLTLDRAVVFAEQALRALRDEGLLCVAGIATDSLDLVTVSECVLATTTAPRLVCSAEGYSKLASKLSAFVAIDDGPAAAGDTVALALEGVEGSEPGPSEDGPSIGLAARDVSLEGERLSTPLGPVFDARYRGEAVSAKRIEGVRGRVAVTLMEDVFDMCLPRARHAHVLQLLGVVDVHGVVHLVTSRVELTLRMVLASELAPPERRVDLAAQAFRGLAHLHSVLHKAHGMLGLDSVVVSPDLSVGMIADFGTTRTAMANYRLRTRTQSGSPKYLAPELLGADPTGPTEASDVFACGVIAIEVAAQRGRAGERTWLEIVEERQRGIPPVVPPHIPGRSVVERAVTTAPESRPAAGELADAISMGT